MDDENYKRGHNCVICNDGIVHRALAKHVCSEHGFKSGKDYYDKYYKSDSEGVCIVCGEPTEFITIHKGYGRYCSRSCVCRGENHKEAVKNSCLEKYGVTSVLAAKEVREKKIAATCSEKYGVPHAAMAKEVRQK